MANCIDDKFPGSCSFLLFFPLKMDVIITSEFERHYNEVLNDILNGDIKIEVIACFKSYCFEII